MNRLNAGSVGMFGVDFSQAASASPDGVEYERVEGTYCEECGRFFFRSESVAAASRFRTCQSCAVRGVKRQAPRRYGPKLPVYRPGKAS